jgi:hypothetical protein
MLSNPDSGARLDALVDGYLREKARLWAHAGMTRLQRFFSRRVSCVTVAACHRADADVE